MNGITHKLNTKLATTLCGLGIADLLPRGDLWSNAYECTCKKCLRQYNSVKKAVERRQDDLKEALWIFEKITGQAYETLTKDAEKK